MRVCLDSGQDARMRQVTAVVTTRRHWLEHRRNSCRLCAGGVLSHCIANCCSPWLAQHPPLPSSRRYEKDRRQQAYHTRSRPNHGNRSMTPVSSSLFSLLSLPFHSARGRGGCKLTQHTQTRRCSGNRHPASPRSVHGGWWYTCAARCTQPPLAS